MFDIFDTHTHYDDEAFDEDREELLAGLPSKGVRFAVNVGASLEGARKSAAYAASYDYYIIFFHQRPEYCLILFLSSFDRLTGMSLSERSSHSNARPGCPDMKHPSAML